MAKIPKVGEQAPEITLESYNKGKISLQELKGKKIVLIFSRYFGCPICQVDLDNLLKHKQKIMEKAELLYITQSNEEITRETIDKYAIDFPVIYSSKEDLYKLYGLGKIALSMITKMPGKLKEAKEMSFKHGKFEGSETQTPGQFVLDEEGMIIHGQKSWLEIEPILEVL